VKGGQQGSGKAMSLNFVAANRGCDSLNSTGRATTIPRSLMAQCHVANFMSNRPACSGIPTLRGQIYRLSQKNNSPIGIEFRFGIWKAEIGHANVIRNLAVVLQLAEYFDHVETKLVVEAELHSPDKAGSAAAPAARCKNLRRGGFMLCSPKSLLDARGDV
jgi:hypothetical protein